MTDLYSLLLNLIVSLIHYNHLYWYSIEQVYKFETVLKQKLITYKNNFEKDPTYRNAVLFDKAADMVGRTLYAMIEGKVADEPAYVARTYADSPDIDGYVFVNTGEMLMSGDFVKVKITGSAEYDLIGELV